MSSRSILPGAAGASSSYVQAQVAAEAALRVAGDAANAADIVTAQAAADSAQADADANASAITTLQGRADALEAQGVLLARYVGHWGSAQTGLTSGAWTPLAPPTTASDPQSIYSAGVWTAPVGATMCRVYGWVQPALTGANAGEYTTPRLRNTTQDIARYGHLFAADITGSRYPRISLQNEVDCVAADEIATELFHSTGTSEQINSDATTTGSADYWASHIIVEFWGPAV